jgi:hypothetical protein
MYSESSGESIYGYTTLFFCGALYHTEYCQLLYVCSQNWAISWGTAISKKLDYHQKPIFVRLVGTERKAKEG